MEEEETIRKILSIIYWKEFTKKQKLTIKEIISSDEPALYKGQIICDFLEIPRRGNAKPISEIL